MRHDWHDDLTSEEEQAMREMGVEPGYNDFSARDVLEAFRKGYSVGFGEGRYREEY
jgi:hypothetical protein